jgi:sulfide:quinone oxidoreductase
MVPVALSDAIAVGEMPTAAQIVILATAGFRSILNAQPDGEIERLLTAAEAGSLARAQHLEYRHIAIESRRPSDMQIGAYAAALAELPKPIYACCYSGSRAAAAWALAAAPHTDADTIIKAVADAGYDIGFLRPQLEDRRTGKSAGTVAAADTLTDAHAAAMAPPTAPTTPPPSLMPKVTLPVAASAGGFAVAG